MSKIDVANFTCPYCGEKASASVFGSINGTNDPQFKQKILDNTVFNVKCSRCGKTLKLIHPLLYHDMKNKAMISFNPSTTEEKELEAVKQMPFIGDFNYQYRLVKNEFDLIEKIRILDKGYDDKIIELWKLFILGDSEEQERHYKKNSFWCR